MQHDAGQIDVAPAFDVELRIAVDLCLRDCTRDRTKLKWFLAGTRAPSPARDRKLGVKLRAPRATIAISLKTAVKLQLSRGLGSEALGFGPLRNSLPGEKQTTFGNHH